MDETNRKRAIEIGRDIGIDFEVDQRKPHGPAFDKAVQGQLRFAGLVGPELFELAVLSAWNWRTVPA